MSQIAEELKLTGFCVCPDFIGKSLLSEIRLDFKSLQSSGDFHLAGIGQGETRHREASIRLDETCWLNPESSSRTQKALWRKLDALKKAFNRRLFLNIQKFDGHYAFYPKNGFYRRHRDSLPLKNDRIVSLVIYLNDHWISSDGGRLRIFENEGFRDVDPIGGTLVCFMSEDFDHEVQESNVSRCSFTGWFTINNTRVS